MTARKLSFDMASILGAILSGAKSPTMETRFRSSKTQTWPSQGPWLPRTDRIRIRASPRGKEKLLRVSVCQVIGCVQVLICNLIFACAI